MGAPKEKIPPDQDLNDLLANNGLEIESSYPMEHQGPGGFEATIKLVKVPFGNRRAIMAEIAGGVKPDGRTIQRPLLYDKRNYVNVFAVSADIEPFSGRTDTTTETGVAIPEYINILIRFEEKQWFTTSENLFIAEDFESSTEFTTLSPDGLFWEWDGKGDEAENFSSPLKEEEALEKVERFGVWIVEHPIFVDPPPNRDLITTLQGFAGTINDSAHTSQRYRTTYPPETLLMGTPEMISKASAFAPDILGPVLSQWSLVIPMAIREEGWNKGRRTGFGQRQDVLSPLSGEGNTQKIFNRYPTEKWGIFIPS